MACVTPRGPGNPRSVIFPAWSSYTHAGDKKKKEEEKFKIRDRKSRLVSHTPETRRRGSRREGGRRQRSSRGRKGG